MRTPLRWTMDIAAGAALVAVVALGAWWTSDRARRWEQPRWSRDGFVLLRGDPSTGPAAPTLWVVAVNPRCPGCLVTFRRLHAAWTGRARPEALAVLIVDSPARPGAAALRGIPAVPVWWDRENRWRRRWGHRLYGEVLEFEASGRYRRSIAADEAVRIAGREVSNAPALERGGGT